MTLLQFAARIEALRDAQVTYQRTRTGADWVRVRTLERDVDEMLARLLSGPPRGQLSLFDGREDPGP